MSSVPMNPQFAGKKVCLMLEQAPTETSFNASHLNRISWALNGHSPVFREGLVGVSEIQAGTGGDLVASALADLEPTLKSRSDYLVLVQPERFIWTGKVGHTRQTSKKSHDGGPILDEAAARISVIEIPSQTLLSKYRVRASVATPHWDPFKTPDPEKAARSAETVFDLLAYEIAKNGGFGWDK